MILLDCIQGDKVWDEGRRGRFTASGFSKVITSKGKASSQVDGYVGDLVNEYMIGSRGRSYSSPDMDRGTLLEPEACNTYEFIKGVVVEHVGLAYKDERKLVSASPDGLVGDDSGLEIKCPSEAVHAGYLKAGKLPTAYKAQVQGCMYVFDRPWWDFMSYHPDCEELIIRVERDEQYITALSGLLERAIIKMLKIREQLTEGAL